MLCGVKIDDVEIKAANISVRNNCAALNNIRILQLALINHGIADSLNV